ncbi:F-box domain-containing protein [Caenorhabditis elegans]|uniref:F-box domain-containing protein n=1 Tax=Caenorhabditis elegans TaxID=6239 RepID=Q9XUY7_CAEEL|nr:F-box domain-containing protein [Caenorhabditis elegans]CAB04475.2 F-box domain-containing protein [Caenorhabditis elegans]|eukprot:NP_507756.2 F-box B protein [Caenorhabditis elegans]
MTVFPILRLPQRALKEALRYFVPRDIINFSLISKSTLQCAKSLNLKASNIQIEVNKDIRVALEVNDEETPFNRWKEMCVKWESSRVGLQELVEHVLEVFHSKKLDHLIIRQDSQDWELFSEALDGLDITSISLSTTSDSPHFTRLVNKFSTDLFYPRTISDRSQHTTWLQKILCSNRIEVSMYTNCSLPNILSSNCEIISFRAESTPSNLNLFLKHWINGSNEMLRKLIAKSNRRINENYVLGMLKGVEYMDTPVEDVLNPPRWWKLEGGKDVYNC